MIRHQLPVYSPVSLRAIVGAAFPPERGEGDARDRLTALLRREYAADEVVLCGSGTQALQLALEAALAVVERDAIVALPAFSCFDVASAAIGADCRVSFYDLDPVTLAPDIGSLERAFRSGARVAVVAPLYGMPLPWDELEACAERHGALLVEDAAQGHGASWRGRRLGSLGRISVLSFGRGKGWTSGGGGALLLRDGVERPGRKLRRVHTPAGGGALAKTMVQWALGRPSLYGLPRMVPGLGLGETVYHAPATPREMPERAAALLLATRVAADAEAEARRVLAVSLMASFIGSPGIRPVEAGGRAEPGYLRLPLRVNGGVHGLGTHDKLLRLGVSPSYPLTLDALLAIQARIVRPSALNYPGALELVSTLVTFPTHSRLARADLAALSACAPQRSSGEAFQRGPIVAL